MGLLGGALGSVIGRIFAELWGFVIYSMIGYNIYDEKSTPSSDADNIGIFLLLMRSFAKIAKADGRVSADEAQFVSSLIREFGGGDQALRTKLKKAFDSSKSSDTDFEVYVRRLSLLLNHDAKPTVMEMFCTLARIDNVLNPEEEKLLLQAENILGTTGFVRNFFRQSRTRSNAEPPPPPPRDELAEAYKKLWCTPSDSDAAIKKAWRKKTMDFHPDKVMGKGLSEEYIAFAEKQMKEINLAYERIKKARSIS